MFRQLMHKILSGGETEQASRARLKADQWPSVIYAIGDVHGCRDELVQLERQIVEDAAQFPGEKWIVMLGDYIDRGPRSADVLDILCARPPDGFRRISLAGNHEVMMLEFINAPRANSDWLPFGGRETLASYGIDTQRLSNSSPGAIRQILLSHIPGEHIDFLRDLPASLALSDLVFVHAGIRPGTELNAQSEADLLWIREPFLSNVDPLGFIVVHGHTPTSAPQVVGSRIGIDTGAFATGVLTALRILPDGRTAFLNTREPALR